MPQPNWNETRIARSLLHKQTPMARVIVALANKFTGVEITDGVRKLRAWEAQNRAKLLRVIGPSAIEPGRLGMVVPAVVIADRERRNLLVPSSITARLCGDPLPGYSAGERSPALAPDITRDPLDALVFRRGQYKNVARYG